MPRKPSFAFLESTFPLISKYLHQTTANLRPVTSFKTPEQLTKIIDFNLGDQPLGDSDLLKVCQKVMENSVRCHHPHFHNQLYGGVDQYALAGDFMTSAMNGTMFTYQIAPCFLLMEKQFLNYIRSRLSWDKIEGMTCPGGSYANMYAIIMARQKFFPQTKVKGVSGLPPLRILTSTHSHYSINKSAIACGLGLQSIVYVECDRQGKMIPQQLESKIKECRQRGQFPFLVNATIGTTVVGALDQLQSLAHICRKQNIWLHADGAFAGSFILTDSLLGKMKGCQMADSFTWDPHKALTVPLQCTFYVHKHQQLMGQALSTKAGYLFHKSRDSYDSKSLDTGDLSLQCGRHIDIFKLWTYFKGKGKENIGLDVQRMVKLGKKMSQYLRSHPEQWVLLYQPQSFNVCFYYIPKKFRARPVDSSLFKELGQLNVKVKKVMLERGDMMFGYSQTKEFKDNFWRMVLSNPDNEWEDILWQMDRLKAISQLEY